MSNGQRVSLGVISTVFLVPGIVGAFWQHIALAISALVIFGAIMMFVTVLGYWPDKISFGQSSMALTDASQAETTIKVLGIRAESATNIEEAKKIAAVQDLILQQEKSDLGFPIYSYIEYEENLLKTLSKKFHKNSISREVLVNGVRIDYSLDIFSSFIYIETKYVAPGVKEFKGVTLDKLIDRFPKDLKILVVSNASEIGVARQKIHNSIDPNRGNVVSWRGPDDDQALFSAIKELAGS